MRAERGRGASGWVGGWERSEDWRGWYEHEERRAERLRLTGGRASSGTLYVLPDAASTRIYTQSPHAAFQIPNVDHPVAH